MWSLKKFKADCSRFRIPHFGHQSNFAILECDIYRTMLAITHTNRCRTQCSHVRWQMSCDLHICCRYWILGFEFNFTGHLFDFIWIFRCMSLFYTANWIPLGIMDGKLKTPQFVHIPPVEEETEDGKCFNEGSENDADDSVPLGLTSKAVCMQVNKCK